MFSWEIILLLFLLLFSLAMLLVFASVLLGLVLTGVPFISSNQKKFAAILQAAELKPGEKFYDLGCGKAHLLIRAAKEFGVKGVGYEIAFWPYLLAKFNVWRQRAEVKVFCQNFFSVDLSRADVVYCYLFPPVMARLEPKFQREMKPGSRLVCLAFPLPHLRPDKEIVTEERQPALDKIFVYRF